MRRAKSKRRVCDWCAASFRGVIVRESAYPENAYCSETCLSHERRCRANEKRRKGLR